MKRLAEEFKTVAQLSDWWNMKFHKVEGTIRVYGLQAWKKAARFGLREQFAPQKEKVQLVFYGYSLFTMCAAFPPSTGKRGVIDPEDLIRMRAMPGADERATAMDIMVYGLPK
jgi:hypothetical protein